MKKLFGRYLFAFAAANLVMFLLFYISAYFVKNEYFEYVRFFACEFAEFAMPVIAASLLSAAYAVTPRLSTLTLALSFALGRIIYSYPSYYLFFVENNLYSSEALLLSIPLTLIAVIGELCVILVLSFVIIKATAFTARRRGGHELIESARAIGSPFDFSEEYTSAVFKASILMFLYKLGFEIYDTALYFIRYQGTYRFEEIIYIVVSFVMILAELLVCQYAAVKITKKEVGRYGA